MFDLLSIYYFFKILVVLVVIVTIAALFSLPIVLKMKIGIKAFFLAPSLGLIVLTYLLTLTSQLGLSTANFTKYSYIYLVIVFLWGIFQLYKHIRAFTGYFKENYLKIIPTIILFLFAAYILTMPMVNSRFLTTVSTGNNDSYGYALTADFLKNNSLDHVDYFRKYPNIPQYADAIINSNRWASVLVPAYFGSVFNMPSFQIFSLLIAAFLLIIPLSVLSFYNHQSGKNYFLPILLIILILFNSQLIYLVYNAFLGQLLFIAIYPCFFYFLNKIYGQGSDSLLDYLLFALIISTLGIIYAEGVFIIIASAASYLFIKFIRHPNEFIKKYFKITLIIGLTSFLVNPHSAVLTYQAILAQVKTIGLAGWNIPRKMSLLEMVGLSSVFASKPFYFIPANLGIFLVVIYGLFKYKNMLLGVMFFINILICLAIWQVTKNSYAYFKITSTILPVTVLIFTIGLSFLFHNLSDRLKTFLLLIFVGILVFNSWPLMHLYQSKNIMVTKDMAAIRDIGLSDKYYFLTDNPTHLWSILWLTYFFPNSKIYLPVAINSYINATPPDSKVNLTTNQVVYLKSDSNFIEKHYPIQKKIFDSDYYKVAYFSNLVSFGKGFGPNELYAENKLFRWMTEEGEINIHNGSQSVKNFCIDLNAFSVERKIKFMLNGNPAGNITVPPIESVESCFRVTPNSIDRLKLIPVDYERTEVSSVDPRTLIVNINNISFN